MSKEELEELYITTINNIREIEKKQDQIHSFVSNLRERLVSDDSMFEIEESVEMVEKSLPDKLILNELEVLLGQFKDYECGDN